MKNYRKKFIEEMQFFIDEKTGRVTYNKTCENCIHDCKQSYKATLIACAHIEPKK